VYIFDEWIKRNRSSLVDYMLEGCRLMALVASIVLIVGTILALEVWG